MSKRLIKIAKELNVATSTIVEHLTSKGYEVDNKPTAKLTEEMYDVLKKEFSSYIEEKEKADRVVIGTSRGVVDDSASARKAEKVVVPPPPPPPPPAPEPEPVQKVEEPAPVADPVPEVETPSVVETTPEAEVAPEVEAVPVVEAKEEITRAETPKAGIKVVGKIDLEKEKPKKEKPKKDPVKKEAPAVAEKKTDTEAPKAAPKKEEEKPAVKTSAAPKEEVMIRAKTPTLQGLTIKGKIDASKLVEKKKPKKDAEKKAGAKGADDPRKRKRKRKKITAENYSRNNRNKPPEKSKPGRRDEVKEVSQKEIEEKIKATMARITGGNRGKRQKGRRDNREVKREKQQARESVEETGKLQLTEFISVSEFAALMDVSSTAVITTCMNLGVIVSINQRLDAEIIELVAGEFDFEIEFINAEDQEEEEEVVVDDPKDLEPRAPIITVMGHVDHGKTSLLDYIRSANVVSGEAGGITQHIGAYEVKVGENKLTFLDTPGHEAFTAMRARGAKVTDIVIIIVAADDDIMPQTKEAISHATAAGVPIVFAINKIDKDGANPDRIKEALSAMNFLVEEWGGKYQSQDISAKTGENIDQLLEKVILEAEMLELKANPNREALGTVVEASLDKGRGYVTKLLVQNGTLKIGDVVVTGSNYGKVKAMFNDLGKKTKISGPSSPVLMLGLDGAPQAGEKFKVVESEQEAKSIASKRQQISREQSNRASKRISLDEIGRRLALGTFKELNLIIKGDVDGSVEALADSLIKLSVETIQVNVIHKAVGQIAESDVLLASASDAIIIGFQVRPSGNARQIAEREGVQIKTYSIIYQVIDEIKMAMEGMLEPTKEEKITAQVEVREVYKISKVGTIAGCFVRDGVITRNSFIRVIREGIVVYPNKEGVKGELASLKRFKDDAKEVKSGFECGLNIKGFNDIRVDDVIEGYKIVEIAQTLG